MTKKVYRSAQGKLVDLGALQLQNEDTRAVGNMPVNARGDLVDAWNHPINSRNQQVARQYSRQVTNVRDTPVTTRAPDPVKEKASKKPQPQVPDTPEDFDDDFVKPATTTAAPTGGLAAAIARAREVKQEPILPPRLAMKNAPGVSKI